MPLSSFIVTGASAAGKTILTSRANELGYAFLPTHTTRPLRPSEIGTSQMISVSEDEFISNFENGLYLEHSLDFALLRSTGVYYGTPAEWCNRLDETGYCASPTSVTVARLIIARVVKPLFWVHLTCPDNIREERLRNRGIRDEEIRARLTTGDSLAVPLGALACNTSVMLPEEILDTIRRNTHE